QGVDIRESYHLARTLNQMGQLYPNGIPYEIMSPEERELTQSHREYILQSLRENRNMSENDMECIADTFAYAAWHLRTQQPAAPATEGGEELWVVAFPKPE
ncbi:MAG: hypothetical protein ACJ8AW_06705, partial [Rhodopila sp.]